MARLRLRVVPGARTSRLVGRYGDGWKLQVAAPPERGAANDAVLGLLATILEVPKRDMHVVSGHASRDKILEVAGIEADDAHRRLEEETR